MTAYGTIESAVEAMRLGAFDYIQKPFTEDELLVKVQKALEQPPARRRGAARSRASSRSATGSRTSSAARRRSARCSAASCASRRPTPPCSSPARAAPARSSSPRRSTPTAARRPPVRPRQLRRDHRDAARERAVRPRARRVHRRGQRATQGLFEEADGGTFFFDEIAETLAVLPGQAAARAPGGRDPARRREQADPRRRAHHRRDQPGPAQQAIAEKRFRQDLYYRLNVARFELPPLRERREDIPLLADHFLDKYCKKMARRAQLGDGVLE